MGASMSGAPYIKRPPVFTRGQRVRCHFGTEYRDGRIEHVARNGAVMVRISAGWVHCVPPDQLDTLSTLEFVPSEAGALL